MRASRRTRAQLAVKRLLDLEIAALVLVLSSPIMVSIAIAIKVSSPGPVLFRQVRGGRSGRPFTLLKFRSMRAPRDASEAGAVEARITRLGRWLRRTSLDELPQLLNVIRGEMSIVGPRPDLPHHVAAYSERQRARLAVRPGLTGWAQIHGRNELTWDERIELDLDYLRGWSLARDLAIMMRTPAAVLAGRGTGLAR